MVMTGPSPIDPSALMANVAAGDDGAFRALTQVLYGPALGTAMKVLGSRAEAEDAVQTALVKLWRTAKRFDPEKAKGGRPGSAASSSIAASTANAR